MVKKKTTHRFVFDDIFVYSKFKKFKWIIKQDSIKIINPQKKKTKTNTKKTQQYDVQVYKKTTKYKNHSNLIF